MDVVFVSFFGMGGGREGLVGYEGERGWVEGGINVPVGRRGSGDSMFTISRGETKRGIACRLSQLAVA